MGSTPIASTNIILWLIYKIIFFILAFSFLVCMLVFIMKYNKLVRDKIPNIIAKNGKLPIFYKVGADKYYLLLKEKLLEEVGEFLESDSVEELADILEVVYALSKERMCSKKSLEGIRLKKVKERGEFKEKIFLSEVKSGQ